MACSNGGWSQWLAAARRSHSQGRATGSLHVLQSRVHCIATGTDTPRPWARQRVGGPARDVAFSRKACLGKPRPARNSCVRPCSQCSPESRRTKEKMRVCASNRRAGRCVQPVSASVDVSLWLLDVWPWHAAGGVDLDWSRRLPRASTVWDRAGGGFRSGIAGLAGPLTRQLSPYVASGAAMPP